MANSGDAKEEKGSRRIAVGKDGKTEERRRKGVTREREANGEISERSDTEQKPLCDICTSMAKTDDNGKH